MDPKEKAFKFSATSLEAVNEALKATGMEATMPYQVRDAIVLIVEECSRLGWNAGIDRAVAVARAKGAYDLPQYLKDEKVPRLRDVLSKEELSGLIDKWREDREDKE